MITVASQDRSRKESPVPECLIQNLIRSAWLSLLYPDAFACKMESIRLQKPGPLMLHPGLASTHVEMPKECNARTLYDLYTLLPDDSKQEFIRLIARVSTAETPFLMVSHFDPSETERFSKMVFDEIIWRAFPVMLREAIRLAKEHPNADDEEIAKLISESQRDYDAGMSELIIAKEKQRRDRKSNPETIKKNVEICDLRKKDKKYWSLQRLAKKYGGVTTRAITNVLKDEVEWRRKLAELETN